MRPGSARGKNHHLAGASLAANPDQDRESMAQKQGSSSTAGGRLDGSIGTALTSSDVALGAGWGTTPVLAITSGSNDQRGRLTITCDATAAQATATVTITFSDGAWASAPFAQAQVFSDNAITDSGSIRVTSTSTTTLVLTLDVLPVDTKIYVIDYVCVA